jgi:hypothetical protein
MRTGCGRTRRSVRSGQFVHHRLAFYPAAGGSYPATYAGGLFIADFSRNCIWFMPRGADGLPVPSQRTTFAAGAAGPVSLTIGPGGDLFYVDLQGGRIRRISYAGTTPSNRPPTAVLTATATTGLPPLAVSFSASGSSDPDSSALSYAWDLDGDSAYDDGAGVTASFTYTVPGSYRVSLW